MQGDDNLAPYWVLYFNSAWATLKDLILEQLQVQILHQNLKWQLFNKNMTRKGLENIQNVFKVMLFVVCFKNFGMQKD